jgi:hypothetical protein
VGSHPAAGAAVAWKHSPLQHVWEVEAGGNKDLPAAQRGKLAARLFSPTSATVKRASWQAAPMDVECI